MTNLSSTQAAAAASITDVQDYWNSRPCNIRHSTKPVGTKEYFDEVEARKYFVEPHIPGFAEFPKWSGKKVLEVGCGLGTDAANFARAGADYTGVELSAASMELAKKRFDVFGLRGNFVECNAEQLTSKLPTANFDLVYSFGVIHHTPNQRAVVEQIRKVIKPTGEFRMMLYAKESWKDIMIEAGYDQPEAQFGCPIATTYSIEMLQDLVGGLFELTAVTQDHIFPYVIEKYVKYEYEPQPWFKAMPEHMFKSLEKRLGWHMLIKARPI
jgi:2-polyprenyl-3-methyl-5-hydroxy-6-metoxy-1,4-benzoquinol methylase